MGQATTISFIDQDEDYGAVQVREIGNGVITMMAFDTAASPHNTIGMSLNRDDIKKLIAALVATL